MQSRGRTVSNLLASIDENWRLNRPLARSPDFLHTFQRRIPNELVNLQAQSSGNVIRQHPFSEFLRVQQAMRSFPGSHSVFPEGRREQYCIYPRRQVPASNEVPGKFVVLAITDHEFHLIVRLERIQVLHVKCV